MFMNSTCVQGFQRSQQLHKEGKLASLLLSCQSILVSLEPEKTISKLLQRDQGRAARHPAGGPAASDSASDNDYLHVMPEEGRQ